jgi:hypothetical protein
MKTEFKNNMEIVHEYTWIGSGVKADIRGEIFKWEKNGISMYYTTGRNQYLDRWPFCDWHTVLIVDGTKSLEVEVTGDGDFIEMYNLMISMDKPDAWQVWDSFSTNNPDCKFKWEKNIGTKTLGTLMALGGLAVDRWYLDQKYD